VLREGSVGLYRKRPLVVEAHQFDGTLEAKRKIEDEFGVITVDTTVCGDNLLTWRIWSLEGPHEVSPGDWIIRGAHGEFYPCKPDIFEATYEPA
jgi:hypothetical protein